MPLSPAMRSMLLVDNDRCLQHTWKRHMLTIARVHING